jgi:hypothetical protein
MGISLKSTDFQTLKDVKVMMVGRLATSSEVNNPIFVDVNGNVKFSIKYLCNEPESIDEIGPLISTFKNEEPVYFGFTNDLENYLNINEFRAFDERKKITEIENLLYNKLIIFETEINLKAELDKKTSEGYKEYKVYKNIKLKEIKDYALLSDNHFFLRIPIIKIREKDFITKLKDSEYIELNEYPTSFEGPQYIYCNQFLFKFENNDWQKHPTNKNMWKFNGNNINRVMVLKTTKENGFYTHSNYTYFIDENLIDESFSRVTLIEVLNNEEDSINDNQLTSIMHIQKEIGFITGLDIYCSNKGLTYEYKDLVNLHTCIKTNMITIISGMTGTGKSQLAWAYSKMLDASLENGNLLFIPISPTFLEPSDLIGYYNQTIGMYTPSETGLVDFLVNAQKNHDKIYMLIFDEMNLAQVEHWFAPFLSLLEADEDNRYLSLYSKNNRCINEEKYPYKIKIGKNIRIIGTINLDETIKEFSDRLLDRANIINLKKKKFIELVELSSNNTENNNYEQYICSSFGEFESWIKITDTVSNLKEELLFFDELHTLITGFDVKKGVSFRVINSISKFIGNIPYSLSELPLIQKDELIDIQVRQRIISKLKGNKRTIGSLIGTYNLEENKVEDSKLIDFFNSDLCKNVSNFNSSKELIEQKSKELTLYGFTY